MSSHPGCRIAPSILSSDFTRLDQELQRIDTADFAHIDVMDGHFVPNLTIGLPVVQRLSQVSPIPLDTHLMIEDPDRWAPEYAAAGSRIVTFHIEAARAPIRLARALRAAGAQAGVALCPATPLDTVLGILDEIDLVLLMTVEPGFGGQSFLRSVLPKITQLRYTVTTGEYPIAIEVDGGVTVDTIGDAASAGADVFVAGSAVYGHTDPELAIAQLRQAATNGC